MPYSNVDYIAERLIRISTLAKNMPPSWDGAKISVPVMSPCGEAKIGKMLPGRGLYLDCDLKSVGITKPLPYVFEKTRVHRLIDKLKSERAAIGIAATIGAISLLSRDAIHTLGPLVVGAVTTYDSIITARAGGNATDVAFAKASLTTVANAWSALFDTTGLPAAGAFTGTPGSAPNSATTGALSFSLPNNNSNSTYLLTFGFTAAQQINMVILADLLSQVGSIAVAGAGATVSSAALTRYTSGAGVLMTYEVTTALGSTGANLTVTYTNQAGTGSRSTGAVAMTASAIVGRLQPAALGPFMQLQSGDFGVQAVATATTSASMVGGALALNLYYPLAMIPGVGANAYVERDSTVQIDGITQIQATAGNVVGCLTLYVLPNTTSTGVLTGFMRTCQG